MNENIASIQGVFLVVEVVIAATFRQKKNKIDFNLSYLSFIIIIFVYFHNNNSQMLIMYNVLYNNAMKIVGTK